jgi:tRNA modification GTPase
MIRQVLGDSAVVDALSETVQVTRERQWQALVRAQGALERGMAAQAASRAPELVVEHAREALEALGEITGETYTEDVLDEVFARFCIGK